jgi:hypothetical protein
MYTSKIICPVAGFVMAHIWTEHCIAVAMMLMSSTSYICPRLSIEAMQHSRACQTVLQIKHSLCDVCHLNALHFLVLPGASVGMPDLHSGYGFAIGNVAAVDMDDPKSVVSPGGVEGLRHQLWGKLTVPVASCSSPGRLAA